MFGRDFRVIFDVECQNIVFGNKKKNEESIIEKPTSLEIDFILKLDTLYH